MPPPPTTAAVGGAATLAEAADEEDAATSILSLPTEVERLIFASLSAADLAACMATCRAWRVSASAPALWRAAYRRRWQHGRLPSTRLSATEEATGRWHVNYYLRRQVDAEAVALLSDLQWPDRRQAAMLQLAEQGYTAFCDVLQALVSAAEALRQPSAAVQAGAGVAEAAAAAAEGGAPGHSTEDWPNSAEWPEIAAVAATAPCGLAYWARHVQRELCVQHCVKELRDRLELLDAAAEREDWRGPAPALASLPRAHSSGPGPQVRSLSESTIQKMRYKLATALEEGAIALAQVHRPSADLSWVRQALDALGEELRRRIDAAGAQSRLDKLRVLNHLLFGPGPPARHRRFAAIPPPEGFGLEITGNRERYYEPSNSLIDSVLIEREGIPISMAVLHAAVGTRAGLPIELLNVPMHVVTVLPEEAEGAAGEAGVSLTGSAAPTKRYYIDVFDGGRIMDSAEFVDFLQGLGLPADTGLDAQAMTPAQCWARMSRNLLHIYREQQDHALIKAVAPLMACAAGKGTVESVRAEIELVNACLALEQYEEAAELLSKIASSPFQVQPVGGAGPLPAAALQTMLTEIQSAAQKRQLAQMRVRRRDGPEGERVLFRTGQVIQHKRYNYHGVIVGWDPECRASEEWMQQMGVDRLTSGRAQPFYHVLPDPEDRPDQAATYVAQENIALKPLPPLHRCKPGFALHPEAGRYFAALARDGACYLLNDWMRHCFPDDPED